MKTTLKHEAMRHLGVRTLALFFALLSPLAAQTLQLDPIGVGAAVTVTGSGGQPTSSVELFRNDVSLGSTATTAFGLFSFPSVATANGNVFYAAAGQVWNFDSSGQSEGWSGLAGDSTVVSGGRIALTNTTGTDISATLYGDGLIRTRVRALEVRARITASAPRNLSIILHSTGANGVAGGGDDGSSTLVNTATLAQTADWQTLVFDLGVDHNGAATAWVDGSAPLGIVFFIGGVAVGEMLEIESVRLTESLAWEFTSPGDFAEWQAQSPTTFAAPGGTMQLTAAAAGSVAMARPFRPIGSTHFVSLVTRLRQITATQPNQLTLGWFSNPAGYGTGTRTITGTLDNGTFQKFTVDLTTAPTTGNAWGAGGAATMNTPSAGYRALLASAAGESAEVDYVRIHPAVRYGPSVAVTAAGAAVPPAYFISSSGGHDLNNGRSAATPWATFANLDGFTLGAGSTVSLKRGDTWAASRLHILGKGTPGAPITLTAYGEGAMPLITGQNLTTAPCIQWENPSGVRINSIQCRDAKIGIYLRYTGGNLDGTGAMFHNSDVHITACQFENMDERWSAADGTITVVPPYELSFGAGVWIGGNIPSPPGGPWASTSTPILDDFSVTFCGFKDVSMGVGANFYFPPVDKSRFTNFRLEDSWVTGCEAGSFALFYVDGGHARRVDTWRGGSVFYATGTTAGFLQDCKNFTVADCEFAGNKRNSTAHDGVGFDIEGDCDNITFTNNVLHDNDGSALLILNTVANNTALGMTANTVWNNARNPLNSGENNEFRHNPTGSTGTFSNIGVYRGANNAFGAVALYDSSARWSTDFSPSSIRSSTSWASVSSRPVAWDFVSSVEGWGSQNQWTSFAATGGSLTGISSGADPYVSGPSTWVNTRERRWVRVRMSQTAGSVAQIFFQTETDATFTAGKSIAFPIIADGAMREYVVPVGDAAEYRGVVTRWRLDPTDAAGSTMAVDFFGAQADPTLVSVTAVSTRSVEVRFNQPMLLPGGGVMSPANYSLTGSGIGSISGPPATVSLVSTATGPVYRLTWVTGHMTGAAATLTVVNAQNARGISAGGQPRTFTTLPEPDIDIDGMPDEWEIANGFNANSAADAALDTDGDGASNLDEYRADTDPRNPASRFAISQTQPQAPDFSTVRVFWPSRPTLLYTVYTSPDLVTWTAVNPGSPAVGTGGTMSLDVTAPGPKRFYKITAVRPY